VRVVFFMLLAPVLLTMESAMAQSLEGVIDIHAHSGPDSIPRKIEGIDLAKLYKARGLRGVVLKNHYEPTASLARNASDAVG